MITVKKAVCETEGFRNIKEYLVTTRNQIKSAPAHAQHANSVIGLDTSAARPPIW